ncbi:class I SAM-dependent methyltransferase [Metasolibacillus sp.]|uniref:class I SAM-dependent methyltransferase n=1 Tax=Metasolibacillus sp. TaxID=2703680 RepID=UPI0025F6C316|nr:class I SAM-dependent methyltransferase [Metasolibacillus sp.]MCT6923190.1 class I SAM-dependent methyltransferase [Metasolibacillus sp.]MCT6939505.1 class I SAM-dependent methyltransferase [Metasolibacillus sp.]
MVKVDALLQAMAMPASAHQIQQIQTAHRLQLIDFWGIPKGANVLEIGCGQGDTLAALAYTVGATGFVHGIDVADARYGAPETLGQARERLLQSELGQQLRIDFNIDIFNEQVTFQDKQFDYIVLSHCIWYFASYEMLEKMLMRIRPWGQHLCLAEWNPCIELAEQLPHFTAVSIQAIIESFKTSSESNVRTMFYPKDIEQALNKSGWTIDKKDNIYSPDLQDGDWEVDGALSFYSEELEGLPQIPAKLKQLLLAQIEALKEVKEIKPMSTFCVKAR